MVDGDDVTVGIRCADVDAAVSVVAANPAVRADLVARQRAWVAERGGGVVEGRDIGTVVLPDADVKIYLTAAPETRRVGAPRSAPRGAASTRSSPPAGARDRLDSTRTSSPLPSPQDVADDAKVIDSTGKSAEDVLRGGAGVPVKPSLDAHGGEPSAPSRRPGVRLPNAVYFFVRWLAHTVCHLYWRVEVHGAEHVPGTGPGHPGPGAPEQHRLPRRLRGHGAQDLLHGQGRPLALRRARQRPRRRGGVPGPPPRRRPPGARPGPGRARAGRGRSSSSPRGPGGRAPWWRSCTRGPPS